MIQIIDADQPLEVESIIMVIFGIPGIGKTSLSFTADNPFLLDFDGGLQRAVKRKKAGRVTSWEEAVEFYQSGQLESSGIKTLIIDTVGTMLDNYIAASVIKADAKNAKRDGSLGLSGYGAMKNVFNQFVGQMRMKKIDVIFIAHDADTEENGVSKKVPKVTGGSYDILKGAADLVGFLYMENDVRVLNFNPTDMHTGKNSAEFAKMLVPHYGAGEVYDNYMGNLIQGCKDKMNALSQEMVEAQQKVEEYKEFIQKCETIDELVMLEDDIENGLTNTYRVQVAKVFDDQFVKIFYKDLEAVTTAEGMDKFLIWAGAQSKKYSNQMRAGIAKHLTKLGMMYDKELKQVVVNPDADKPVEPPKKEPEANAETKPKTTKAKTSDKVPADQAQVEQDAENI